MPSITWVSLPPTLPIIDAAPVARSMLTKIGTESMNSEAYAFVAPGLISIEPKFVGSTPRFPIVVNWPPLGDGFPFTPPTRTSVFAWISTPYVVVTPDVVVLAMCTTLGTTPALT